ncbi:hypothetical protein B0H13DRAFT_2342063 [Mycena leptocephala]|nr:hypothetical protein B0H13DRAFT_2342063 [Mycena leptocephala]
MSAIDFLHAHIDGLSSAVKQQEDALMSAKKHEEEVLQQLLKARRDKEEVLRRRLKARCDVYRELNSVVDPMQRLPVEISSAIFVYCLPEFPHPSPGIAPMVFLHVCHAWSSIVVSSESKG